MRSISVFSVSMVLALSACGQSGEGGAQSADSSDSDAEQSAEDSAAIMAEASVTAGAEDAPESLIGSWRSPSCERRVYERRIQFNTGGTFAAQDLISPCPPDVVCFWSGILHHKGTYALERTTIKLEVTEPRSSSSAWPFPTELVLDPATGGPAEVTPEGKLCSYVRVQ